MIQMQYPTSFVSIDFETQYSSRASVCAVGMVKYIDNKAVDEYYSLIEPPWEILNEYMTSNEYIHGIKDSDLVGQKRWPEILLEMEDFCCGLPLVAHNAPFEKSCIKKCNEYYNLETTLKYVDMLDTLKITKECEKVFGLYVNGKGSRRLDTLCEMYEVTVKAHHNALADSYMGGDLLVKMNTLMSLPKEERDNIHITVPIPKNDHLGGEEIDVCEQAYRELAY